MFPVSIIPSIIGAGASLVGGYINNQYAQSRADQQWNRTLYMQDKMNAYNAPVAQMQRLSDAGLNPNLVYANGGTVIQSAGGQPPAPPQSHPLDTQGVLQMVQTIVGAMLEKDKIQANKEMHAEQIQSDKDIAEAHNTTQKEVTGMQTQSNEKISTERNETEKGIADENRKENARQFNETLKQRISEFNDTFGLNSLLTQSQVFKNYSDAQLNQLRASIEQEQFSLSRELLTIQRETALDASQRQKLDNFISKPYKLSYAEVNHFFAVELGVQLGEDQIWQIVESHNNLVGATLVSNRLGNSWLFGTIDKILGPIKAVLGMVK